MPERQDLKLRQARERGTRLARREDEGDPLSQQATGYERERPRRRTIEPLRVVDGAQQRSFLRCLRHETEDRQADQERRRSITGTESERDPKSVALGARQTLRQLEDR